MLDINIQVAQRIRSYRKMRKMTLEDLSQLIHKSKSTISKYEKAEIAIDIQTLYEISIALNIQLEQLIYIPIQQNPNEKISPIESGFFHNINQFYSYLYDGRTKSIIRCVFDVISKSENGQQRVILYMNFKNYENYQNCENTYIGTIEHYDALTNMSLTNHDTPMEKANINILASYLTSDTKWGLFNGFSSRPMMPIAIKMLFSRKKLEENDELIEQLKVSKEDIRLLKLYNMLCVL